ncbi:DUF3515 family protein [Rathayibacter toxicus]|uniref:DUF3515 domain-containing protein n=1 Tax=Rathayibacter toxicus TaxID=145458 RepID=A0A0C5BT41_9MICO|nr:DUF3515 family protein [Rathayibacter toxicus]AJM77847.1 hypothetical protein TI83_07590 [Rathayibacter toxicus]ALS57964.1 hypothetical protein APU90_09490 [Rathayibacter toxicus]KKM44321.1 hypothetical protein VT73_10545 [Rathayibacter toxicus]PPG20352.1 DUF3515 domain-containing protein [Rathayibacter toxicus]PPG45453.1 DUF3515 domain-containing protein [Rathayibacter toxicus]
MIPRRAVHARRAALSLVLVAAVCALVGCSAAVALDSAPAAADKGCAEISVRLPHGLNDGAGGEIQRRETTAQGTAAWGSPATVLLRCGVEPPVASPHCIGVNGVDWIRDDSGAPQFRFITFGRVPATEVIVDSEQVSGSTVLLDLVPAISAVAPSGEHSCQNVGDIALPPVGRDR